MDELVCFKGQQKGCIDIPISKLGFNLSTTRQSLHPLTVLRLTTYALFVLFVCHTCRLLKIRDRCELLRIQSYKIYSLG
jgi:hypothetical protein